MVFEQETRQERIEEQEKLKKLTENEQFQQELDKIIARLENEQFQKELDEIIEHLNQRPQHSPSIDRKLSSKDFVKEGEHEELQSFEKSIQEQKTTKMQKEEIIQPKKIVENRQFQKDLDLINRHSDQVSQQFSFAENQTKSHDPVTEEKKKQEEVLGPHRIVETQQRVLQEQDESRIRKLLNSYGKRVLSDPSHENVEIFTTKWNEYVTSGREVTKSMKLIFNEIVTYYERDIIYRVMEKEKPILKRRN